MAKEELERVIEEKVKPLLNEALQKHLGIGLEEITVHVSERLKKGFLWDFPILDVPWGKAKKLFRKHYLARLLQIHEGNITKAAMDAGLDRRSIHRLMKQLGINAEKFRRQAVYGSEESVSSLIGAALAGYRKIIQPKRLELVYKHIPDLSRGIISELPVFTLKLREAEEEFAKEYIRKLVKSSPTFSHAAKRAGLRYETLHRKLKKLPV